MIIKMENFFSCKILSQKIACCAKQQNPKKIPNPTVSIPQCNAPVMQDFKSYSHY